MTTFPSRRAVVAGLAAAPVGGFPAVAQVAASANDPVLFAVAEHARLKEAARNASAVAEAAREAFEETVQAIGEVTYRGEEVRTLERLESLRPNPQFILTEAEIEEIANRFGQEGVDVVRGWASAAAEYEPVRAALVERLPAYENARRDARLDEASIAAEDAWQVEGDAEVAVFEVAPTTPAGAIALIRFAADFLDELGINDTRVDDIFTEALRNAAALLERGASS